jgi:hypothetical protein
MPGIKDGSNVYLARTLQNFRTKNGTQMQRYAQNKVLAIMEHWIFEKQAYLCTGSEKITKRLINKLSSAHLGSLSETRRANEFVIGSGPFLGVQFCRGCDMPIHSSQHRKTSSQSKGEL